MIEVPLSEVPERVESIHRRNMPDEIYDAFIAAGIPLELDPETGNSIIPRHAEILLDIKAAEQAQKNKEQELQVKAREAAVKAEKEKTAAAEGEWAKYDANMKDYDARYKQYEAAVNSHWRDEVPPKTIGPGKETPAQPAGYYVDGRKVDRDGLVKLYTARYRLDEVPQPPPFPRPAYVPPAEYSPVVPSWKPSGYGPQDEAAKPWAPMAPSVLGQMQQPVNPAQAPAPGQAPVQPGPAQQPVQAAPADPAGQPQAPQLPIAQGNAVTSVQLKDALQGKLMEATSVLDQAEAELEQAKASYPPAATPYFEGEVRKFNERLAAAEEKRDKAKANWDAVRKLYPDWQIIRRKLVDAQEKLKQAQEEYDAFPQRVTGAYGPSPVIVNDADPARAKARKKIDAAKAQVESLAKQEEESLDFVAAGRILASLVGAGKTYKDLSAADQEKFRKATKVIEHAKSVLN